MVSTRHKLILLLPPKTGSSSFVRLFLDAGVTFDRPVRQVSFPVYHLLLSEIQYIFALSDEQIQTYRCVQITRNPYRRAVSAWLHQMELTGTRETFDAHVKRVSENRHLLPHNPDKFYSSFYGDPDHKQRSFKKGNWGGMRFYFQQQWWNDLEVPLRAFKLEELSESTLELAEYCQIDLPKMKKIKKNMTWQFPGFNYYSNNETVTQIQQLYQTDFQTFSYDV